MFDFHKLFVYQKSRETVKNIYKSIRGKSVPRNLYDQLSRASSSILLNIAEGAWRSSRKQQSYFYSIARGSTNECAALLDILTDINIISAQDYLVIQNQLEEIIRMLIGLQKSNLKRI